MVDCAEVAALLATHAQVFGHPPWNGWYVGAPDRPGVDPNANAQEAFNRVAQGALGRSRARHDWLVSTGWPMMLDGLDLYYGDVQQAPPVPPSEVAESAAALVAQKVDYKVLEGACMCMHAP
jgi:hypothetical protein